MQHLSEKNKIYLLNTVVSKMKQVLGKLKK